MFIVTDESNSCYIIKNGEDRLNRYFSLNKSKVKLVIPLKDKTLALELQN